MRAKIITTDNRYIYGEAQFLILGMEKVTNRAEQTPKEIRRGAEEENMIQVRSTTSDISGETGNTVPSKPGQSDESTMNLPGKTYGSSGKGRSREGTHARATTNNTSVKTGDTGQRDSGRGEEGTMNYSEERHSNAERRLIDGTHLTDTQELLTAKSTEDTEMGTEDDGDTKERWEMVPPKKGTRPCTPTIMEKIINSMTARFSGSMGGYDP